MSSPGEPETEDAAEAQATLQRLTNGYWITQIIYVAAKLGIADLLKGGRWSRAATIRRSASCTISRCSRWPEAASAVRTSIGLFSRRLTSSSPVSSRPGSLEA